MNEALNTVRDVLSIIFCLDVKNSNLFQVVPKLFFVVDPFRDSSKLAVPLEFQRNGAWYATIQWFLTKVNYKKIYSSLHDIAANYKSKEI